MIRTHALLSAVFILTLVAVAGAQSKLQLTVHTGHGVNGYDVNSTMISGEKDMLLIDPQFSLHVEDPSVHCELLVKTDAS